MLEKYILCIRINKINPLFAIIILTLKKYYFLWVASISVWIILDTRFLVQDDEMITALSHFTCTGVNYALRHNL